jgi:hypothetical protein
MHREVLWFPSAWKVYSTNRRQVYKLWNIFSLPSRVNAWIHFFRRPLWIHFFSHFWIILGTTIPHSLLLRTFFSSLCPYFRGHRPPEAGPVSILNVYLIKFSWLGELKFRIRPNMEDKMYDTGIGSQTNWVFASNEKLCDFELLCFFSITDLLFCSTFLVLIL